ncbi:MAG: T9SS type A sorting domain-containing protein [Saprospiraceae bacterium]|nr:T9SS type A sorting domain-containing protein [Saprospiraceae bacterium]
MLRILVIIIILFLRIFAFCQKEDHIWLFGQEPYDVILPDRASDTTRGASNIDFNYDPPKIYYAPDRFLDFSFTNSSLCNSEGKILAFTNGQVIYNQFDDPIEDTINYSDDWEYCNDGDMNLAIPSGLLTIQGAIIMPVPGNSNRFYTFYTTFGRYEPFFVQYQISYAMFEVSDDDKLGKILKKDIVMLKDSLSGSITAISHGNGRDWWLIAPRKAGNTLHIWLIDPDGIHYQGRQETDLTGLEGIGQIYGSPDGEWLSWFVSRNFNSTGGQHFIAKFDRCTGKIYNPALKYVDLSNYRLGFGISFSHDSRYLFMCNRDFIYQYDLKQEDVLASETKVATYDGYKYYFPFDTIAPLGYSVNFCALGLGPDGRIYISPSSASTRMMSVIHHPYHEGESCVVKQHSLIMPTGITRGIPNFPNYRTGPLDNSPCDTLGLDNDPVAKFRYEADTLDHLLIKFTDLSYFRPELWRWDFGDGSPVVEERYPYHRFPKNGSYNVCLTVSNENSNNTICRNINISTSASDEPAEDKAIDISLYPNPIEDILQVTLGEYIPENGHIKITDISGRQVLSQRLYYGQNVVDLSQLSSGFYFCVFMDGHKIMKTEKVVKME